jgi:hypothetical protein
MTEKTDGTDEASYYARVEDYFVERRGSPLFISPAEWDLVCRWERQGIPLEVVQEGIDRVFERPNARTKPRKLGYCRQTVEAAFRRFREAGIGAQCATRGVGGESEADVVRSHLRALAERLRSRRRDGAPSVEVENSGVLARRLEEVASVIEALAEADPLETPMAIEKQLESLDERLLSDSEGDVGEAVRAKLAREAEISLASYRTRMPDKVYRAALESAYRRRVRKTVDLPTLSLYDR